MRPRDRDTLVALLKWGNNSPTGVADRIGSSRQTITECLSRLESEGLVEREAQGVWRLTPAGIRRAEYELSRDDSR